jgi:hypothetical protein
MPTEQKITDPGNGLTDSPSAIIKHKSYYHGSHQLSLSAVEQQQLLLLLRGYFLLLSLFFPAILADFPLHFGGNIELSRTRAQCA